MGERPPQPMPEDMSRQTRLEDLPEFLKLAPEQQEKVLAARERMMAEAMSPQHVVTRSIEDMGFWKGMGETIKPHLKKQKEIMFKELKANASLALSLIPVIGEGKGLGTGLLGITAKEGKALTGTTRLKNIQFEPFVRLSKAAKEGKKAFVTARGVKTADKLWDLSKGGNSIFANAAFKVAYGFEKTGAIAKDTVRSVVGALAGKKEAARVLGYEFSESASHGAKVMATRMGVEGIQVAQQAKKLAKAEAYMGVKTAVAAENASKHWITFPMKWARSAGGEVRGRLAAIKAGKEAGKAVTDAVKSVVKKTGVVGWLEGGVKRAAPTIIEGTKFGKFHAFFDRWLNLTPDIPVWLSTTTGVAEFLGAHGIDAIPAVMQMGINRYKSVMVSKDMALDVLGYTAKRGLKKIVERKQAAEVFAKPAVA